MELASASRTAKAEGHHSFKDVASVVMALEPSYPVFCLRPEVIEESARRFMSLFPGTDTCHQGNVVYFR